MDRGERADDAHLEAQTSASGAALSGPRGRLASPQSANHLGIGALNIFYAARTLSFPARGRRKDRRGAVSLVPDGAGAGGAPPRGRALFVRRRPHVSLDRP